MAVTMYSGFVPVCVQLLTGLKTVLQKGEEHAAALESARGHWLLALAELEEPARRPGLLLVGGLPGSGKSTLARAVAALPKEGPWEDRQENELWRGEAEALIKPAKS